MELPASAGEVSKPSQKLDTSSFDFVGKWTIYLAADKVKSGEKSVIDCAYIAHPSLLSLPNDAEKVKKPLSCACSGFDYALPRAKAEILRNVLDEKVKKRDEEHEFVMYETAHHGFAIRGRKDDEEENRQGQQAEDQAVNWFRKWLKA